MMYDNNTVSLALVTHSNTLTTFHRLAPSAKHSILLPAQAAIRKYSQSLLYAPWRYILVIAQYTI